MPVIRAIIRKVEAQPSAIKIVSVKFNFKDRTTSVASVGYDFDEMTISVKVISVKNYENFCPYTLKSNHFA